MTLWYICFKFSYFSRSSLSQIHLFVKYLSHYILLFFSETIKNFLFFNLRNKLISSCLSWMYGMMVCSFFTLENVFEYTTSDISSLKRVFVDVKPLTFVIQRWQSNKTEVLAILWFDPIDYFIWKQEAINICYVCPVRLEKVNYLDHV